MFREFSIRGIADRDLTDEVVISIGQAIGAFFGERDGETRVVGWAGRASKVKRLRRWST